MIVKAIAGKIFKAVGGGLLKQGLGVAGDFLKRKQKRQLNKDEIDAKYDLRTLKAGEGSLKDEYLTLITTAPLLQMFVGSIFYALANWRDPEAWFRASAMFIENVNNISGPYAAMLSAVYTFVFGKGAVGIYQRGKVKMSAVAKRQENGQSPRPKKGLHSFIEGNRK